MGEQQNELISFLAMHHDAGSGNDLLLLPLPLPPPTMIATDPFLYFQPRRIELVSLPGMRLGFTQGLPGRMGEDAALQTKLLQRAMC